MAFTGRTPESLIPRSDSRNPATTCKGITKSGRPCRRPIDAKLSQDDGVLAVTSVISASDDEEIGAAAYFCWQHKDQAEQLVAGDESHDTHLYPLKERKSIDTLVERLGVLEVDETVAQPRRKRRENKGENRTSGNDTKSPKRINRPPTWDNVEGPLISIPSDVMIKERRRRTRPPKAPQRKKQSFWSSLCCTTADDDGFEVSRHKRRPSTFPHAEQYAQEMPMQQSAQPGHPQSSSLQPTRSRRPISTIQQQHARQAYPQLPQSAAVPVRKPLSEKSPRPVNKNTNRRVSETTRLLQYIPSTLSPQLTSTLLSELSKPISPHDEEGYIYIFWLTPDAAGPAPSSTASSLLAPPSRPEQNRRTSDVLRQYSVKGKPRGNMNRKSDNGKDISAQETILLKIGRANNVHRRMNEWTRQCGYSLSLVRYYPYVSSTPSSSPSPHTSPANSRRASYHRTASGASGTEVRKVPHAHRVERLIHLELGDRRVVKRCDACGKEHREWFEVEASREGVKGVDEVVRRWVGWAEERLRSDG